MEETVEPFDWARVLLNDLPWTYLGEVAFRTIFMFVVLLTALTVSGKREVRQLSIYEIALVIGLGSAAGDPMFYHDVPLASAIVVFIVIMGCYKLATYLSDHNKPIRDVLEGVPVYVVENGCILTDNFDQEDLGLDELFADLRVEGIEQLGQVRVAILEPSGQVSVFLFNKENVRPGLPILPKELDKRSAQINKPGEYACCACGNVQVMIAPANDVPCNRCSKAEWVEAKEG